MTSTNFGFYFEEQRLTGAQGPNDPSGEYFSSSDVAESLAREVIQNCLDARADSAEVVRVVFELRDMASADIPGIGGLRSAFAAAVTATSNLQGSKYMVDAGVSAAKKNVQVLRIGDYGTVGLRGSESVNDPQSALSTLTRSSGASSNDGQRGGSFGIGSAVGPFASRMRTVAYVSLPEGQTQTVFAATSKLASHKDKDGVRRQGTGHFTDLNDTSDFAYMRGLDALPGFEPRSAQGTDVYILDYRDSDDDPALERIKRATLESFFVAIHRGRLEVSAVTATGTWELTASTIAEVIAEDDALAESVRPFYLAITDGVVVQQSIKHVGQVSLHVYLDDEMQKKYGTQLMRGPLMRVQILPSGFHVPFAAVFICADEVGNKVLRDTEPPTHDKWSDRGPRANGPAVWEVKKFIREELRKLLPEQVGAKTTIKGLASLLPKAIGSESPGDPGPAPAGGGDPTTPESAVQLGRPEIAASDLSKSGDGIVQIKRSGVVDAEVGQPGSTGERTGGKPGKPSGRTGKPSPVRPADGRSRIQSSDIRFRSFSDGRSEYSVLLLTSPTDIEGDLELAALGGGEREVFGAELASAIAETPEGLAPLELRGSTIRDLKLRAGVPLRMRVVFGKGSRYRLGVKDV